MQPSAQDGRYEAMLVVERRELVADDVVALTLVDPQREPLPQWSPGAHMEAVLTPTLARQFSLCGDPGDREQWRIAVLREPHGRGGSQYVHDELDEGAKIRVRGPRNHFPLISSPAYRFIAGGIGITPILPMIQAAERAGADWQLLYGGRRHSSMAFLDELARYGQRVHVHPQDRDGLLDLDRFVGTPSPGTLVYCCGPEGLITAVEALSSPWPKGAVHVERFRAEPQPKPQADASTDFGADFGADFDVECRQSGITVAVPPGRSIYETLLDAGVGVVGSCLEGVCGTCECDVLEGQPDHRDSVLSEDERDRGDVMMICVSRSRSRRLVLDI